MYTNTVPSGKNTVMEYPLIIGHNKPSSTLTVYNFVQ